MEVEQIAPMMLNTAYISSRITPMVTITMKMRKVYM